MIITIITIIIIAIIDILRTNANPSHRRTLHGLRYGSDCILKPDLSIQRVVFSTAAQLLLLLTGALAVEIFLKARVEHGVEARGPEAVGEQRCGHEARERLSAGDVL